MDGTEKLNEAARLLGLNTRVFGTGMGDSSFADIVEAILLELARRQRKTLDEYRSL